MPKRYLQRLLPFLLVAAAAACTDGVQRQPVVRAAAHPSSVRVGEAVSLSGTVSNTGGSGVSFAWEQTGGEPPVVLGGAGTATATFTAPATPGILTFRLTVTVPQGAEASAEVTVQVEGAVSVSAGGAHTCRVRATGTAACRGDDSRGQSTPPGGAFTALSAGGLHTCGVRENGEVACWGDDAEGQSAAPEGPFVSVSAGGAHTCGVLESGEATCWGSDSEGQATSPGGRFVSVSAGGAHTCGLRESGVAACWGNDAEGQSAPPGGLFTALSAGDFHTCGVREGGAVTCWGRDAEGQSTAPAGVFVAVSAGGLHTCGLRESGRVECWGLDDDGRSTPPEGPFASVSAGGMHSCGVGDRGAVTCWPETAAGPHCVYLPPARVRGPVPGLTVAADVLLPEGYRPDYGVHIRFNGSIGAVGDFETVRASHPDAALLDCRGNALLSPGFVNAHEHPAYSYAFPDENLNPGYAHRDEWRLGINGKLQLPPPPPYWFDGDDPASAAILVAMELRHLLGGATTIAGSGGAPGVIRNINRQRRDGDLALYDAEAEVTTFPYSFQVVEDLRDECAGGPAYRFPVPDSGLTFMAYVPHVGEGRYASCAARAEVARYLERVQRRDRRYSLVHGVATDREDFAVMREFDVTLVWSPRSNLALYGETVDLAGALESGVRVALSTDWSPSGSYTMREEAVCAKRVARESGMALSNEALWRMSTGNGAYALGLEDLIGAIVPGLWADLILVTYTGGDPYEKVLTATDEDTLATWIGGRAVLVSGALSEALGGAQCVTLDDAAPQVCGVLDAFGLSPEAFDRHTQGVVPLNDAGGQAPCGDAP